jgi:HNH endonuclease
MSNCALCDTQITSANDSAEHLILNALGGFRKVNGFICKSCDDVAGHKWDAELAAQLNGLCHFFAIERERGSIPPETINTTAGETFKLLGDGGFALMRPTVKKTGNGAQTQYRVVARDKSEARKILADLKKKKAPNLDIEAELGKAEAGTSYLEGLVELPVQIGGPAAGRAIVKSTVALAHESGIPSKACDQALAYLRDRDAAPCFGYYQTSDLLIARPVGAALHCIAISGDPATGMLIGYAEYFGFLRVVILLSESYSGPESRALLRDRSNNRNRTRSFGSPRVLNRRHIGHSSLRALRSRRHQASGRCRVWPWNGSQAAAGTRTRRK